MLRRYAERQATRTTSTTSTTRTGWLLCGLLVVAGCAKSPELAEEHLRRGEAAIAEGHFDEAMSALAHAHELLPEDPRIQKAQMHARVAMMAETPGRIREEVLADVAYEATLLPSIVKGTEGVCLVAQGNIFARRGDREGAKKKLEEATKAEPNYGLAHAALGALLMADPERMFQAKEELEFARTLDRKAKGPLVALGKIDAAQGNFPSAVERLEEALRLGEDLDARLALGSVKLKQGKHVEAAADLANVVERDPNNADALSAYGQALLGAGRVEQAERALRSALGLRRDVSTSIALGFTLDRQKRNAEALALFVEILNTDATSAPALFGAGVSCEALSKADEAIAFYRKLLAIVTDGPQKAVVLELQRDARGRLDSLLAQKEAEKAKSTKDKVEKNKNMGDPLVF